MTNAQLAKIKRGGGFLARWGTVLTIAWGAASVVIAHIDRLVGFIHGLDVRVAAVEQYRQSHDSISHERLDRLDKLENRIYQLESTRVAGWADFDRRIRDLEQRRGE